MNPFARHFLLAASLLALPAAAWAQAQPAQRPALEGLEAAAPSERVRGEPGRMTVVSVPCRAAPTEELRARIVDLAVQEWAFFGFPVLNRLGGARLLPPGAALEPDRPFFESTTRRAPVLNAGESARVAATIAGYWAVTPEGPGIVAAQNQAWNGRGVGIRWGSPWSAAFISWVMCEAGLGTPDRFRRAIAHWTYIDQAIRARDGGAPGAAYEAWEIGEREVEPGDLLCSARRPAYRTLAERRRQMGTGARTHCDVVVHVDAEGERILAVGGNVLRSVSLKVLGARRTPDGGAVPRSTASAPLFAHLRLRADPVEGDALLRSPVLAALVCGNGGEAPLRAGVVFGELGLAPQAGESC
jgi:hypothetical protein